MLSITLIGFMVDLISYAASLPPGYEESALTRNCKQNSAWLETRFNWDCDQFIVGFYSIVTNLMVLLTRNLCDITLVISARAIYKRQSFQN